MTIAPADGAPQASWWCAPRSLSSASPVVLYLHGGAFSFGSFRTHGELVSRIALATGARVFFPEYRLAPEHPYPAAIDDAMLAYEHLLKTEDPARIVIAGDSAGGNLTAELLLRARDQGLPLPAGGVMLCPWVDVAVSSPELEPDDWITGAWGDSFRAAYLGERRADDPRVSPLYADLHGLPPLLVQVGSAEILERQVTAFVEKARAAGVDVTYEIAPGMVHVWHMFAALDRQAQDSIDSIARFVRQHARTKAPTSISSEIAAKPASPCP